MKRIFMLFLALTLLLCGCVQESETKKVYVPEVTGSFEAAVLKIGKADAVILTTENHAVIIDCGEKGDGKDVLNYLSEKGIEKLDYLFITHFDKDHVGGAAKVIKGIEIGEIVTPDYEGNVKAYENYVEALSEKGIKPNKLLDEMNFTLDDVVFSVYPPMHSYYEESDNDYSLVISVTHGENTFLFAGDAETERLSELPGQIGNMAHDFVKMPHHGKYDVGLERFVQSVNPKYAVITCSNKESAEEEALEVLRKQGCEIYLTVEGTVKAISDGKTISVEQEPSESET